MPYDQYTTLKGLRFPFAVSLNSGSAEVSEDAAQLESCLKMLMVTERGSRPMFRAYGLGVRQVLQEPNDEVAQNLFRRLVFEEVAKWEPRVIMDRVEFNVVEEVLHVVLYYEVVDTGRAQVSDFAFPGA